MPERHCRLFPPRGRCQESIQALQPPLPSPLPPGKQLHLHYSAAGPCGGRGQERWAGVMGRSDRQLPAAQPHCPECCGHSQGVSGTRGGIGKKWGKKSLVIKQSAAVLPRQARQEINECVGQPLSMGKPGMSLGDATGWEMPSHRAGTPVNPERAPRLFLGLPRWGCVWVIQKIWEHLLSQARGASMRQCRSGKVVLCQGVIFGAKWGHIGCGGRRRRQGHVKVQEQGEGRRAAPGASCCLAASTGTLPGETKPWPKDARPWPEGAMPLLEGARPQPPRCLSCHPHQPVCPHLY